MSKEELINAAQRIASNQGNASSVLVEASEFFRLYAGEKSAFYRQLQTVEGHWSDDYILQFVRDNLFGFISFYGNNLADGLSIERRVQIDVVSDYLEQANSLLSIKEVHPAAPCVLIGASLEEFLRNWVEGLNLDLHQNKPSLDTYCKALKEEDLITKQDFKDIISWAGLRNHAAHGQWEEVTDRKRVALMLEGVNLFMRKYSK